MRIVQCQACRTRFRIDESRIRGRGARMRCRKCGESIIVMKDPGIFPGPPPPDNLFDLRSKLKQPDPGTLREEPPLFAPRGPEEQAPQVPPESAVRPPSGEVPPGTAPEAVGPTVPEREPDVPTEWEMPAEEPAIPTGRPEEPLPEAPEEELPEARDEVEPTDEPVTLRISGEASPGTAPEAVGPTVPEREPDVPTEWEMPAEEPAIPTGRPEEPLPEAPEEELPEARDAVEPTDEPVTLRISGEASPGMAPEAVEPTVPERETEAPAAWEMPAEEPAGPTERPEEPLPEAPEEELPEARDAAEPPPGMFVDADPADPGERKDPSGEAERVPHEKFTRWEEPPSSEEKPFELLLNDAGSLDFLKEEHPRAGSGGELDISGILRSDPSPEPEPAEAPSPFSSRQFPREDEPMPDRLEAIQRELREIGGGSPERMEATSPSPAAVSPVPPVRQTLPPLREAGGSREKIRPGRPSLVPLAILFLLIAGGGAYLGFTPRGQEILRRMVPAMESLWLGRENAGARFSMEKLIGYYEPDAKAGTLYVIKGTVTNRGPQKRSGVRVMAELFGSNRMYLGSQVVFAGNVLSGDALRTYSREAIGKEMANRWGDKLSNLDIAPGNSVPFMVVFFDAPEGIEEYRLEAWDGG